MVVFSGANSKDKEVAKDKFLLIRNAEISAGIKFLLENNTAYSDLSVDVEGLARIDASGHLNDLITDQGDEGDLIHSAAQDGDRVDNSNHIHSVSGMFSLNNNNVAPNTDVTLETVQLIERSQSETARENVRVINSNQGLNDHDPEFFGSAFPELFPYGIGSPNHERPVSVSFELGLRHLLKLRDRRFAQHHCFPLLAFDMMARRKVT
jgi:hypothetical protein